MPAFQNSMERKTMSTFQISKSLFALTRFPTVALVLAQLTGRGFIQYPAICSVSSLLVCDA